MNSAHKIFKYREKGQVWDEIWDRSEMDFKNVPSLSLIKNKLFGGQTNTVRIDASLPSHLFRA